jgi:hypothetical protein
MGLLDWLNSFLGKKEESEIKLEPDGVKEFESNEEIQTDIKETLEEPKPEEAVVIEEMQAKPVKASRPRAKAKSRSRKKGRK